MQRNIVWERYNPSCRKGSSNIYIYSIALQASVSSVALSKFISAFLIVYVNISALQILL